MVVKGYKAFNKDLTCRGFKFEIGKVYELSEKLQLCGNGFHFCTKASNVYEYYPFNSETRVCEIETTGEVLTEGDKSCTNKIHIIRELSRSEILEVINTGVNNTGRNNSGNRNSGDRNSGYGNSGYGNSGYFNSGNYNSGAFNSDSPKVRMFNKDTNIEFNSDIMNKINNLPIVPILQYIPSSQMTNEEKLNNKSHETTGGFLRKTGRNSFCKLNQEQWDFIASLPNFTPELFKAATGEEFRNNTI